MTPVAILVRVSSDRQKYESQIAALEQVARQKEWQIVEVIATKQSTYKHRKKDLERDELDRLRELAASGAIKKVLIWGVSRIGRNNLENHQLLNDLNDMGISFYVHYYGMETLLPNGKKNPMAYCLFLFFGELAESENEERRANSMRGQQQAKAQGKHIGRPKGTAKPAQELLKEYSGIVKDLKSGLSIRKTAAFRNVSVDTVQRVKRVIFESA